MALILGKKLGPKQELGLSAAVMLFGIALWYFFLYQPVSNKTEELRSLISSQEDSLKAENRYRVNVASLNVGINQLDTLKKTWDARFPDRSHIVDLATQILNFSSEHELELVEMKPSLYELYALEKAGARMSGRYIMQIPLNCRFRGEFLEMGKMLEDVATLPFNMSIADVSLEGAVGRYPLLDIRLRLFLYVHL